jgi:hypothetical protein
VQLVPNNRRVLYIPVLKQMILSQQKVGPIHPVLNQMICATGSQQQVSLIHSCTQADDISSQQKVVLYIPVYKQMISAVGS